MVKEGVYAIGISEETSKNNKIYLSFFYNYNCPHCKRKATLTGFPVNMEDFVADITDIMQMDEEDLDIFGDIKKKKTKKSNISDQEVDTFKEQLKKISSHEDFLKKIGIDIDSINKMEKDNDKDK